VTYGDAEFTAALQRYADEDHARQPNCSWCGKPGTPYEHNGIRFDGLTACQGERLCGSCTDRYLAGAPLLILSKVNESDPGVLYDLNDKTAAWSEQNIPGCRGEVPATAIAAAYRYADWPPPGRRRGRA
jgi:hypothetical protein